MHHRAWIHVGRMRLTPAPSWQLWLLMAGAAALGVAVTIVAAGVALILLPVALLAFLAYRLWASLSHARPGRRPPGIVIEGEYEIVRADERKPKSNRP